MDELYIDNDSLCICKIIFNLFYSLSKYTKYLSIIGNDTHTQITIPLFDKCVETVGFAFKRGFHPNSISFCNLSTFSIIEGISPGVQFDNMYNLSKINIDYCSVRLSEFFFV